LNRFLRKYNPNKAHIVLLIILAIIIPSGFYNVEGIIIPLLFLNWLLFIKGYERIKQIPVGTALLFCFFMLYLISFFITDNLDFQLKATTQHLSYILIPFSLIGVELSKQHLENIKRGFIWATLTFILIAFGYALFDYLNTGKSTIYINNSVQSKFQYYGLTRVFKDWHPTYVSLFCNLALVFIYNIYIKKRRYIIAGIIAVILGMTILSLNSFIGILGLWVIVSLYFILLIKVFWKRIVVVLVFIGLMLSFYHFNPFNFSKIDRFKVTKISIVDTKDKRNILNLRLAKWQVSYDLFKTAPFFGVTPGDYRGEMVELYKEEGFDYAADRKFSSHNQYLNILASFGLVGFILFLTIIIYPLRFGGETTLFLLVFSLFWLTEDLLLRQQGIVLFSFFYTILQLKVKTEDEV